MFFGLKKYFNGLDVHFSYAFLLFITYTLRGTKSANVNLCKLKFTKLMIPLITSKLRSLVPGQELRDFLALYFVSLQTLSVI